MPDDDRPERPPDPVGEEKDRDVSEDAGPEAPNEGSPGHHPTDDDARREDRESEQSFPASDPPANYQ